MTAKTGGTTLLLSLLLLILCVSANAQASQIRAYWADAFHDGFFTAAQVDKMIQDVKASNCNAIVAQLRRRGDTYYPSPYEPYAANADPSFDALAYLIQKAHAQNPPIEVHVWLCTLPISTSTLSKSPFYPYYLYPEFLTKTSSGKTFDGSNYCFDPGNPDALQYVHDVYMDIVKRYNLDGIHYDYVRFASNAYGYNDVSVARFNKRFGRTGLPTNSDAQWSQWRRDQVTAMVRKIYIDAAAIRPTAEVSGATITWGNGPGTNDGAWTGTSAYSSVMQDWRAWMEEGILDINMPMTYYNYSYVNSSGQKYSDWYDNWVEYEKNHKYNRHLAVGPGVYLNSVPDSYKEIVSGQAPSTRGIPSDGMIFYSYAVPSGPSGVPADAERFRAMLTKPNADNNNNPPYPTTVPFLDAPWKVNPTKGMLRGTVCTNTGVPVDGAEIVLSTGRITTTDGTGFYGFIELDPGTYAVTAKVNGEEVATGSATVEVGKVATADLLYTPQLFDGAVDDTDTATVVTGEWTAYTTGGYQSSYRTIPTGGTGANSVVWHVTIPQDGSYEVYARWPYRWDNTWQAPYTINHNGGATTVTRSQVANSDQWVSLGSYSFSAGDATVMLSDAAPRTGTQLRVVADAVRFVLRSRTLGRKWYRTVPGEVNSSPTVSENGFFIGDKTGHLYAMRSEDGGYLWKYPDTSAGLGAPITCRPAYDGTNVYFCAGNKVYAVNATTGQSVWSNDTTPTLGMTLPASPVATSTLVYVGADDKRIYALNKATGAIVRTSPALPDVPVSTPVVPGLNSVWVGLANGDIVSLSEDLSTIRFSKATGSAVVASPNVDGSTGRLYVGSTNGKFYCLNATTGNDVWAPLDVNAAIASSAWVDMRKGIVYFGTNAGASGARVYALNAASGALVAGFPFAISDPGNFSSSPVVLPGPSGVPYIYIGNTNGTFYAINANDPKSFRYYSSNPGATLGEKAGQFNSSPAIIPSAGLVVIGNTNGRIYGMKLQ